MRKTLITALVIAGAASQVVAQLVKEDTITLALSGQKQVSVSTSQSTQNAGKWSDLPRYYKTGTFKYASADIIKSIDKVLRIGFSSKASLVLVQGELSGFFNMDANLHNAAFTPVNYVAGTSLGNNGPGPVFDSPKTYNSTLAYLAVRMANGRHLNNVPAGYATTGSYPPGHLQPWGQIYVKDPDGSKCLNVTHFFTISVEECYDCFYLNSFISDTTFTFKAGSMTGPPCCSVPENLTGSGKDRYYMMFGFDNTTHNPFLNDDGNHNKYYRGRPGIKPFGGGANVVDGVTHDGIAIYQDPIALRLGTYIPEVARFTLNGIMTYSWSLKLLNKSDLVPDFIGTGKFEANGYGFFGLYCSLLTGTVTFSEKTTSAFCCASSAEPWYNSWYGLGYNSIVGKLGGIQPTDTPVNETTSLTYHAQYNEDDESYIQHSK